MTPANIRRHNTGKQPNQQDGSERADQQAAKGVKTSHNKIIAHKTVTDIWAELGLEEIPDMYDTDSNGSGGSQISDEDDNDVVWVNDKRPLL